MGRRRRRAEAQGRAQGRVRGRVREGGQRRQQGRPSRGGEGRNRATLDVDAIEGYANRLSGQLGGSSGLSGSPRLSGGSGLAGAAASGLAGAASGLAGGSLASRLTGGRSEASEDFENEVRERLDLMDERLRRLEEVLQLRGGEEAPEDPAGEMDPESNP